jgi:ketosteroid isomerase-like protein
MKNKVEQEIRQLNQELDKAYVQGDTATMNRIFADDLSFISPRGIFSNKIQVLAFLNSGDINYEFYDSDDIDVRIYEDTAVVTSRLTRKGRVKDQDISGKFRYTRVYVKRQEKWQVVAVQATRIVEETTSTMKRQFSDLSFMLKKLGLL